MHDECTIKSLCAAKLLCRFLYKDEKLEQLVLEFKKHKRFWYPEVDVSKLNDRIFELKNEGWIVVSIIPNSNWLGVVKSYSILLQNNS